MQFYSSSVLITISLFRLLLTVVRVLHSAVVARPHATFGLLQDSLVSVGFALRWGLQLLHHILELLKQLSQLLL